MTRKGQKITPPSRERLDANQRRRSADKRSAVRFVAEGGIEYAHFPHSPLSGLRMTDLVMRRAVWDALWTLFPECYPKVRTNGDGVGYWRLHGIRVGKPCRDAPIARVLAAMLWKQPKGRGWRAACMDGDNSNMRDANVVYGPAGLTRASARTPREVWKRMRRVGMSALGATRMD